MWFSQTFPLYQLAATITLQNIFLQKIIFSSIGRFFIHIKRFSSVSKDSHLHAKILIYIYENILTYMKDSHIYENILIYMDIFSSVWKYSHPYEKILIRTTKIAIYCPQGSGTLRQQLIMMHGIAWSVMVLDCIEWYCMVLHSIAWNCTVLLGFTWYCIILHGFA